MKKIMTMFSAMVIAATMNAENVNTEAFTQTQVNVPARVRFVKSDTYSFRVVSENKIVAESIKAAVKDGVLSFNLANGLSEEEASDNNLTIVITAPGMPEFKTSKSFKAVSVKANEKSESNSYTYNK
ncbi:MAG: hypothetical protein K6E54_03830 [Bacteroidaceae bacterium]|nr:hypothetical protein [Bacteroidaceae bacterium]